MSVIADVKMFFWLYPQHVSEDPIDLLRRLYEHKVTIGDYCQAQETSAGELERLHKQVVALQAEVSRYKEHAAGIEKDLADTKLRLAKASSSPTPMLEKKSMAPQQPRKPVEPELPDLLDNPDFRPCRDEACMNPELHAEHVPTPRRRGAGKKLKHARD